MKKTVKGLIIAASVAAVVGVGAVSFAAWQAGSVEDVVVTASAGSINTIGSLEVKASSATGDSLDEINALFPVNQGAGYLTYWEFEVTVEGDGEQTVTVAADITQKDGGDAALFYSTEAPSGAVVSGAKALTSAQPITGFSEGKATVYIYMTSDKTEAMNATIELTFAASATAED